MNYLFNAFSHFKTITKHKIMVMKGCFELGLYKQGLLHDLSKYSPSEFLTGVKYYQGFRSPNTAEVEEKGYSTSWLHHKGRNKHHFEYWIDFRFREPYKGLLFAPMPVNYIAEMFVDRVTASKVYNGDKFTDMDPLNYYKNSDAYKYMNPKTRRTLEGLLKMYAKKGEKYTYRYIRKKLLKNI